MSADFLIVPAIVPKVAADRSQPSAAAGTGQHGSYTHMKRLTVFSYSLRVISSWMRCLVRVAE